MLTKTKTYEDSLREQHEASSLPRRGSRVQIPFPAQVVSGSERTISAPTVRKLCVPQRLVITLKRTRTGFEASARGSGPSVSAMGSGADPGRAVSECMAAVAASLEVE